MTMVMYPVPLHLRDKDYFHLDFYLAAVMVEADEVSAVRWWLGSEQSRREAVARLPVTDRRCVGRASSLIERKGQSRV